LASLYGRSRIADKLRIANVVISNVPGPQVPLYLAGAKMVGNYPLSIVVHGIALNITVQSYMGQLDFGLIACRRAMRDVDQLALQLHKALEILRTLARAMPAAAPVQPQAQAQAQAQAQESLPPQAKQTSAKRSKPQLVVVAKRPLLSALTTLPAKKRAAETRPKLKANPASKLISKTKLARAA
jgi:hypothetical protein